MQAHANDLRVEVARDWSSFSDAAPPTDEADLDAFVHQAVDDWRRCPLNAATFALLEYAESLTARLPAVSEANVQRLRAAGVSDRAIHDAAQVSAYFNYINRLADGLGVEPEPDLPTWGR